MIANAVFDAAGVRMFTLPMTPERIKEALRATGGHRARAAKLLGISRATIFRKIKEFGID